MWMLAGLSDCQNLRAAYLLRTTTKNPANEKANTRHRAAVPIRRPRPVSILRGLITPPLLWGVLLPRLPPAAKVTRSRLSRRPRSRLSPASSALLLPHIACGAILTPPVTGATRGHQSPGRIDPYDRGYAQFPRRHLLGSLVNRGVELSQGKYVAVSRTV